MAAEVKAINWTDVERKLMDLLKLKYYPVGFKVCKSDADFKGVRIINKDMYTCQLIRLAVHGYAVGLKKESLACTSENVALGITPEEKGVKSQAARYASSEDIAKQMVDLRKKQIEGLTPETFIGFAAAPLSKMRFDPDAIVIIGEPWAGTRVLHAYGFYGKLLEADMTFGVNAIPCMYGYVKTSVKKRLTIVPPCSGAIEYGKFHYIDMTISIPPEDIEMVIKGLEETRKRGIDIPHLPDLGVPPKAPKEVFK